MVSINTKWDQTMRFQFKNDLVYDILLERICSGAYPIGMKSLHSKKMVQKHSFKRQIFANQ